MKQQLFAFVFPQFLYVTLTYYSDEYEDPFIGYEKYTGIAKAKTDHYKTGIRFGSGVERFITNRFSVKLSDMFTYYGSMHAKGCGDIIDLDKNKSGTIDVNSKVKFRTQTIFLDFNYAL